MVTLSPDLRAAKFVPLDAKVIAAFKDVVLAVLLYNDSLKVIVTFLFPLLTTELCNAGGSPVTVKYLVAMVAFLMLPAASFIVLPATTILFLLPLKAVAKLITIEFPLIVTVSADLRAENLVPLDEKATAALKAETLDLLL
jgi:hypothetical protein